MNKKSTLYKYKNYIIKNLSLWATRQKIPYPKILYHFRTKGFYLHKDAELIRVLPADYQIAYRINKKVYPHMIMTGKENTRYRYERETVYLVNEAFVVSNLYNWANEQKLNYKKIYTYCVRKRIYTDEVFFVESFVKSKYVLGVLYEHKFYAAKKFVGNKEIK